MQRMDWCGHQYTWQMDQALSDTSPSYHILLAQHGKHTHTHTHMCNTKHIQYAVCTCTDEESDGGEEDATT